MGPLLFVLLACPAPVEVERALDTSVKAEVKARHRWEVVVEGPRLRVTLRARDGALVRERVVPAPGPCPERARVAGAVLAAWMMESPTLAETAAGRGEVGAPATTTRPPDDRIALARTEGAAARKPEDPASLTRSSSPGPAGLVDASARAEPALAPSAASVPPARPPAPPSSARPAATVSVEPSPGGVASVPPPERGSEVSAPAASALPSLEPGARPDVDDAAPPDSREAASSSAPVRLRERTSAANPGVSAATEPVVPTSPGAPSAPPAVAPLAAPLPGGSSEPALASLTSSRATDTGSGEPSSALTTTVTAPGPTERLPWRWDVGLHSRAEWSSTVAPALGLRLGVGQRVGGFLELDAALPRESPLGQGTITWNRFSGALGLRYQAPFERVLLEPGVSVDVAALWVRSRGFTVDAERTTIDVAGCAHLRAGARFGPLLAFAGARACWWPITTRAAVGAVPGVVVLPSADASLLAGVAWEWVTGSSGRGL